MTNHSLKKLADNYMQIWNAKSEGLLDIYADKSLTVEYTHFDRVYEGIEDYKVMLQTTYNFFPDLKITVDEVIPNKKKNSATVLWNYTGTHQNGTLFGVKPSEKRIIVNGMTVLKMENRRIVNEKGIVDNLSLLMQLNA